MKSLIALIPFLGAATSTHNLSQAQPEQLQAPLLPDLHSTTNTCEQACTSLSRTLTCPVHHSTLPAHLFDAFYSLQQSSIRPTCLVLPTTAQDVSDTIQIIAQHDCIFAVKSGGHAFFPGASNADGGITIDLRYLNGISVDAGDGGGSGDQSGSGVGVAWVGSGNRWKDVYRTLEPLNVTVVGGRDQEVGVGGFVLGGGISFLSRGHGWACDNVMTYELVLANGTITNVSHTSHPDLYFALRGGGNNFGIVTRFALTTYPLTPMWGGQTLLLLSDASTRLSALNLARNFSFTPSSILETFAAWLNQRLCYFGFCTSIAEASKTMENFDREGRNDTGTQLYTYTLLLPKVNLYVVGGSLSNTKPEAHPPAFASVRALSKRRVYDTLKVKSLIKVSEELGGEKWNPAGSRQTHVSTIFRIDTEVITRAMDIWMQSIEPIRHVSGLFPAMIAQSISEDVIGHFQSRGGNAVGVAPGDGPLVIISAVIRWKHATDDTAVLGVARDFIASVEALAKEKGVHHRFIYQNYAAAHQEVFKGYGEENLERLREISRKYDPEGVFGRRLQPGYFKL